VHVIHISFGLAVGGQEKLLVELARHSDRNRFDLTVVSLGGRGELAAEIESCGAQVVAMGKPSGLRPSLVYELARLFQRLRADVVHAHDHRALFYGGPAAWAARVPLLVNTRHGRNCHFTSRQVAVGRHLARLADRYVCVSDDVQSQCLAEGIAASRLWTIKNGIDVERFSYSGPSPDGPVVAVARLSPEKDIANLLRAAALAAPDDPGLKVAVAGNGPCLAELEQLVTELGIQERVAFLGEVRDVPALLARARMFVLPSQSEGISLTLLEAMACGLPAVATRVGGTPEVVLEGQTGLLVPPRDPAALAQAIAHVGGDPELGLRMGRAGRERVQQHFDVRRMVADYESLYIDRVKRTRRARPLSAAVH
jgi:glycosyltransferase involved in cell wall biosynthesis